MEWSDIRVFLQVVRAGTMAGATSALHLDHSTISRRISRLERGAKVPLFERAGRRLALTPEGNKLVLAAERLESIVIRDVMSLSEQQQNINGHVRIGATEDFGVHYLGSRLGELTAKHPDLEIELVAQPRSFSLPTREVDIAVTLDRPMTGDVRYKKLIDFCYDIYASEGFFDNRERPTCLGDLADETWCGYIPELLCTSELELLPDDASSFNARYRTTSVSVQLAAAVGGYAVAALPCFIANHHPGLQRVLQQAPPMERTYWLAVHEDMAKSPRVRAVMDSLEALVGRDRNLFYAAPSAELVTRSAADTQSADVTASTGRLDILSLPASAVSAKPSANSMVAPARLPS